jgi:hypothetical protein
MYEGNKTVDGTMYGVEDNDDGPGAFRACLDVGLARTSTGARVSCWLGWTVIMIITIINLCLICLKIITL